MRAYWPIGIGYRDRSFKDGLKGLPNIKPLGLSANQYRYRLAFVRNLACRFGCRSPPGLRGRGAFTRRRDSIDLLLQISLGCVPLHLQLRDRVNYLPFGFLSLLLGLGSDGTANCNLGAC